MRRTLGVVLMVMFFSFVIDCGEKQERREFNARFNALSPQEKFDVFEEFVDILDWKEDIKIYRNKNNENYFSPARGLVNVDTRKDGTAFTSYLLTAFTEEEISMVSVPLFVLFHELSHAKTVGVADMKQYSKDIKQLYVYYAEYKKVKERDFIAFNTGDADNYTEDTKRFVINKHYRQIPAERTADLGAMYLLEECQDIITALMDGDIAKANQLMPMERRIKILNYMDEIKYDVMYRGNQIKEYTY